MKNGQLVKVFNDLFRVDNNNTLFVVSLNLFSKFELVVLLIFFILRNNLFSVYSEDKESVFFSLASFAFPYTFEQVFTR